VSVADLVGAVCRRGFSPRRLGRSLGWRFSASHHSVRTRLFVYHAAGRAQGWFPCVPLGWSVAPCLQRDGVWPGRRDGASLTGRRLYWVMVGRPLVRYRFNREWFWGNFY